MTPTGHPTPPADVIEPSNLDLKLQLIGLLWPPPLGTARTGGGRQGKRRELDRRPSADVGIHGSGRAPECLLRAQSDHGHVLPGSPAGRCGCPVSPLPTPGGVSAPPTFRKKAAAAARSARARVRCCLATRRCRGWALPDLTPGLRVGDTMQYTGFLFYVHRGFCRGGSRAEWRARAGGPQGAAPALRVPRSGF